MATSLYRKHRPQQFKEISGQRHVILTLQRQIETDRVAHAYLFSGPRGTGKTTASRILAKAVNCQKRAAGTPEPCNACPACTAITSGSALDVMEIDAASHTGVDHVREHIIGSTRVAPSVLRRKVFIIDEVHMLSLAAFNALLKTLEEPPPHVLFILATTEIAKLPPTIVSRCQRFDFRKISFEDIVERLSQIAQREQRRVGDGVFSAIASNADGSVRDAESLLEQVLALGDDPVTLDQARLVIPYTDAGVVLEFVRHLVSRQLPAALDQVNRLAADGVDLEHFSAEVAEWLRYLLLSKCGARLADAGAVLTAAQAQQLTALGEGITVPALLAMLSAWIRRVAELRSAIIPQLPLELAVVEICGFGGTAPAARPASVAAVPPNAGTAAPQSLPGSGVVSAEPAADREEKPRAKKSGGKGKRAAASAQQNPAAAPHPADVPPAATSLQAVLKLWPAVLGAVKTQNFSLFSILRIAVPVQLDGSTLRLAVAYEFHLQRLAETKNRIVVERAAAEVVGCPLRIEAKVLPQSVRQPTHAAEDAALQPLLEGFGGKLVE